MSRRIALNVNLNLDPLFYYALFKGLFAVASLLVPVGILKLNAYCSNQHLWKGGTLCSVYFFFPSVFLSIF